MRYRIVFCILALSLLLSACGKGTTETTAVTTNAASGSENSSTTEATETTENPEVTETTGTPEPLRSNTPVILIPEASGDVIYDNDLASIDASHLDDGYVMAKYTGSVSKVKIQVQTPQDAVYTYYLHSYYEAFPLTEGDGTYKVTVYENVEAGTDLYAQVISKELQVRIANEFSPYLYPNQYVDFDADTQTIAKGAELAAGAGSDLEVVTNVYNYIIENITYDYDKANSVKSGYVPNVDEILHSGTGICFDYAAVMATMLRTQQIPTRLVVGYAGTAYHAWISTHIDDLGWVNGIIEFDGTTWKMMDPTFAASQSEKDLRDLIGDGDNYQTKYKY